MFIRTNFAKKRAQSCMAVVWYGCVKLHLIFGTSSPPIPRAIPQPASSTKRNVLIDNMISKSFVVFFCLLLALALATELKGGPEQPPEPAEVLPTADPFPHPDGDKLAKEPKLPHSPKEPKHPKEKHHKEKDHKKLKDPKDKHPKENEPVAATAAYAEPQVEAAEPEAAPKAEATEQEETKPAPSPIKKKINHSFPMNRTEAAVEDEAQKAACGTCCGVDMGDMAGKLPFINRK